jgi:hypothetical protein
MTLNILDWIGIDVYQVYGAGTVKTGATIISAACDIGYTNKRNLWLYPGAWTVTADVDVSDYTNIFWTVAPGATITVTDSTMKFPAPSNVFGHPLQPIFTLSGSGNVKFANGSTVHPGWFGVIADGSTSNDTALGTMCTSLGSDWKGVIEIPHSAVYTVGTLISSLPCDAQIIDLSGVYPQY